MILTDIEMSMTIIRGDCFHKDQKDAKSWQSLSINMLDIMFKMFIIEYIVNT